MLPGEFSLPGSRPLGCLLVHGFTATPAEMRPLGEALAAAGHPVLGVRLAGHGTSVDDLARTRWHDWAASVAEGAARLTAGGRRIAIVGMSLGALLALHHAAHAPTNVAAVVCCGTPLRLPDWRLRMLRMAATFPGVVGPGRMLPKGSRDISDPALRAASVTYDRMPLASVVQLLRLQQTVRRTLRRVTSPALLLHGRHDHSVPVANLELARRSLRAAAVEAHVLERSWHVVTEDVEREQVARLTIDFLGRVGRPPGR